MWSMSNIETGSATVKSRLWGIREAKSHLSEVLRRARRSGPQYIGKREPCVLVSVEQWETLTKPAVSLSSWLLDHRPGVELELPERGQSSDRPLPFSED